MSEKPLLCPKCKSEIHPQASICPHCRTKLKGSFLKKLGWVFVCILFISFCNRLTTTKTTLSTVNTTKSDQEYSVDRARRDCKWAVKSSLHDPDAADFDNTSSFYSEKNKLGYLVQVTGRAKNGFGALRRITVNCTISGTGKVLSIKQIN